VIAALCYVFVLLAWTVDLLTPQLFIASVLLNGPIALSTLALRRELTVRLTVLAEIANAISGYVNGVSAGHHWDPAAIGDRILAGASYILVAALTIRAQETARRAGESGERERQIAAERALRHAMENVRASLNVELILRRAMSEALTLARADSATIVTRTSRLEIPDRYELHSLHDDVQIVREPLSPQLASVIERAQGEGDLVVIAADDALGRLFGETLLVAAIDAGTVDTTLILTWANDTPTDTQRLAVRAFVENCAIALAQARLFVALAQSNEQIARQKDELQARSEVIRDIVYALAHDLRTPLAAADVTMTQALAGAYGELPDRYREIVQTSLASNHDIRRLAETLLLVARYESGEDSRIRAHYDIGDLVDRVVRELSPLADVKGVALRFHRDERTLMIYVDGDEVRRALANLVANAIEATPRGGDIDVTIEVVASSVVVAVEDDGYGVPLERQAVLFQRFAGVRVGGGTGLGLYLVRRIAEKYGGRVGYEPRAPQGSRFSIELPLAEEQP